MIFLVVKWAFMDTVTKRTDKDKETPRLQGVFSETFT